MFIGFAFACESKERVPSTTNKSTSRSKPCANPAQSARSLQKACATPAQSLPKPCANPKNKLGANAPKNCLRTGQNLWKANPKQTSECSLKTVILGFYHRPWSRAKASPRTLTLFIKPGEVIQEDSALNLMCLGLISIEQRHLLGRQKPTLSQKNNE